LLTLQDLCYFRTMTKSRKEWQKLGKRVARARAASHLNQQDLATKIGIDRTAISKVESGSRGLDALELARLAKVLKRPIDWFVASPLSAAAGRRDARRKQLVDDSPADIVLEDLARDVELLRELEVLVEDDLFIPEKKVSDVDDARAIAEDFRRFVGINHGPLWELQRIAEGAGLFSFSIDLEDDNLDGSYLAVDKTGVALINGRAPTGRRRFTLAHELGHHLFQDPYSDEWVVDQSIGSRERLVNAFAIHFLLPASEVEERWTVFTEQHGLRASAIIIAAEYGISWTAVCAHLVNLNMITTSDFRHLDLNPPRRHDYLELGIAAREDLVPPAVPPKYAQAVIKAYKGHKISGARAIEMLKGTVDSGDLPDTTEPPLDALQAEL